MATNDLNCDELGIPQYLHRNHRKIDNNFDTEEWLYRRIEPEPYLSNGEIGVKDLKIPGLSVNRGKYTKSPKLDVLYNIKSSIHFFSCGIARIKVGFFESITLPHPTIEEKNYTFKVLHDPTKCMYPHSILSILDNKEPTSKDLPKTLRLEFRDIFKKKCSTSLIKKPS